MCGIAGVLDPHSSTPQHELEALADAMGATLAHRGPDDSGVWCDPRHGVALAHRRLAVLDLSPDGRQPMQSRDGRYTIVYNGELYNFRELRAELEASARTFRGSSDTEVLLEAVSAWGLDAVLERANGMFGFALWDHRRKTLTLARDRLGEKPLYYGLARGRFIFGSELKAVRAHPGVDVSLDRNGLSAYLRSGFVPAPATIFSGVRKLPPGSLLTVPAGLERLPSPTTYWSLEETVRQARADPFVGDERDAIDELDRLLRDSVRIRSIADVPLGAFLSGGVDSSVVVAAMQAAAERPPRTFTVAFAEPSHDEARHAKDVAAHLGTEHTEIAVSPEAALDLVPRLAALYDEPFADPSALPTAIIAREARRHVTVCLSGDGGDELFGGYNRYTYGPLIWRRLRHIPRPVRTAAGRGLLAPSHATVAAVASAISRPLGRKHPRTPADKIQKLGHLLQAGDERALRDGLVSQAWPDPAMLVTGPVSARARIEHDTGAFLTSLSERMMFADSVSVLPDCMLTKVDRASMHVGLEARLPLLDPRIVEFAWRLPLHFRINGTQGKWLLRQVLYRSVPKQLVDRPKTGFDPPLAEWLRGPLRTWGEELLDPSRLAREGLFDPRPIRRRWSEHLAGRHNWDYSLWSVLVFQSWLEQHDVR